MPAKAKLSPALYLELTLSHKRGNPGSLKAGFHHADGYAQAPFAPDKTLAELIAWSRDPADFGLEPSPRLTISFDHDSGRLTVHRGGQDREFDPTSDESLASMVRHIKALTPLAPQYHAPTPSAQSLPIPTEAELAARTIMSEVQAAEGYRKPRPKPRYNAPSASEAASLKMANDIVALLAGQHLAARTNRKPPCAGSLGPLLARKIA